MISNSKIASLDSYEREPFALNVKDQATVQSRGYSSTIDCLGVLSTPLDPPLINSICVKPLRSNEAATSRTTPTNVAGDNVTVPANDP